MDIVLAIISGLLFGYALYLVGATSPKKIVSMLRLEDLTLMKTIVLAIGFASILLSLFSMPGLLNIGHLSVKTMNLGVITGGLLFGIGFGTVGTCPGTCVAATSSGGARKAVSAVLGGLLGAWAFSMTYGWWSSVGLFSVMDWGKLTLFHISDKFPSVFSLGYAGLLIVGILFVISALILPGGRGDPS
ncbi:DUF6691 family protein [Lawsonibacter faecis]|uniref:YeeE/YedE family protein n=1 Tax=Lawsonibacter faecis TaxID=2763052 RepID=A0A8J6JIS7_9FIRM|nr:DUF6691 family protein [Lawsonibacter faecis]MBC5735984.1 YeeE/YedE family protein [Lawsonibacter faecis]